jgi:subtilisin
MAADVDVVRDSEPQNDQARRVVIVEADPVDMAIRARDLPADVILEPEILHWPAFNIPIDFIGVQPAPATAAPAAAANSRTVTVQVLGSGNALAHAKVLLFLRGAGGAENKLEGVTNGSGVVTFTFLSFWRPAALVAVPYAGFWTMVLRGLGSSVTVDCPQLPQDGPTGWWHEFLGSSGNPSLGAGIRVGVADTGIGRSHPALAHVSDVGAFLETQHLPNGGNDVDTHGSHVCGIIGARPTSAGGYAGIAPGVDLFSARVFPAGGGGANQADIAEAIDELSRNRQADLINLSLGARSPSRIEQDAILDALQRGTVCVCSAGNEAGAVSFPAAFPETVAVSALGLDGWGPAGSLAASRLPSDRERFGDHGLYLANFSCFGPEVTITGPGVGILSTVPERHGLTEPYAVMDGTSMSSPAVCAVWAALLAADASYVSMPRNGTRAHMALAILRRHANDIRLDATFQGAGIPILS